LPAVRKRADLEFWLVETRRRIGSAALSYTLGGHQPGPLCRKRGRAMASQWLDQRRLSGDGTSTTSVSPPLQKNDIAEMAVELRRKARRMAPIRVRMGRR
jgi:hypothetical protein